MVRSARFFLIPNYGSSGACTQKMSQIGLKLMIWWPKQSSVIEKIKPHRARILFVNDNFSNNHCSKHTPFFVKAILIVPLLAFSVYLIFGTVSETSIQIVEFPFIKLILR